MLYCHRILSDLRRVPPGPEKSGFGSLSRNLLSSLSNRRGMRPVAWYWGDSLRQIRLRTRKNCREILTSDTKTVVAKTV